LTPTNLNIDLDKVVDPEDYDDDTRSYVAIVERVAPRLINRTVKVKVINDDEQSIRGCFEYETGIMHVNLAYQDTGNPATNYDLMIHELAHNTLNSNAHLKDIFYRTVQEIAGKLTVLALEEPELFEGQTGNGETYSFTVVQPIWDAADDVHEVVADAHTKAGSGD